MKKKMIYIIASFIVLIVIAGSIFLIYKKIDKKNKEKKEIEENIVSNYLTFREKVEDFNGERKIYSVQVASDLYKSSLDKYEDWIKELDKYTETVNAVDNNSSYLKDKCLTTTYDKQDIKNKCEAFIIAYETAVNYYAKDIKEFNDKLKEITDDEKEEYKEYESKYNYTDINKDGKFFGKD